MPERHPVRNILVFLVIAAILGSIAWKLAGSGASMKRPPMSASPVRTAKAIAQDVPHYLQGLGTVVASSDVLVTSRVQGHLQSLHFTEGQRVQAGDLLAQIDPRPYEAALAQAKGALARDEAELANAKLDKSRYASLASKDYVARQTFDQQSAKVRQLEGTIVADKGSVQSAELNLAYSKITAPVSGRLGLRLADIGSMIAANDTTGIVRVTEISPCYLVFTLPEADVPLVIKALRAQEQGAEPALVEAWSRDQKERLSTGKLFAVDNRIDTDTGTIRLKAIFENADEALYANEFVNARLKVRTLKDAVTVPPSAVQIGSNGSYVYIVDDGGVAHMKPVVTGLATGAITVVEQGLAAGEIVVADGVDRLKDGAKVRVAATLETVRLGATTTPLATEQGMKDAKPAPAAAEERAGARPGPAMREGDPKRGPRDEKPAGMPGGKRPEAGN